MNGFKMVADGVNSNDRDKEFRNGWTQTSLSEVSGQNLHKNVMVSCLRHM